MLTCCTLPPASHAEDRPIWYEDLVPQSDYKHNHEYFYQVRSRLGSASYMLLLHTLFPFHC